jgi:hypothetical protein
MVTEATSLVWSLIKEALSGLAAYRAFSEILEKILVHSDVL